MKKSLAIIALALASCSPLHPVQAADKPQLMIFTDCGTGKDSIMVRSGDVNMYMHHTGAMVLGSSSYRHSKIDDLVVMGAANKDDVITLAIRPSNTSEAVVNINGKALFCKVTKFEGEF